MEIRFDERGLVPVVIQDWASGEVLTLAYANSEAIERTRETGELHLWSRSRDELWRKGATSGNVQRVRALRLDCDGDAVLALGGPRGAPCPTRARARPGATGPPFFPLGARAAPACHTGARSCFFEGDLEPPAPHEALPALER